MLPPGFSKRLLFACSGHEGSEIAGPANRLAIRFRMIPVPTLSRTRRNIRALLVLGSLLAVLIGSLGALIFFLGRSRPEVTQPFWEFGCYVLLLCLLNLAVYLGLFWQVGRLSRRPEPRQSDATVTRSGES